MGMAVGFSHFPTPIPLFRFPSSPFPSPVRLRAFAWNFFIFYDYRLHSFAFFATSMLSRIGRWSE